MAPPTDERKPVTVLFADLVGSTELANRQDPEQLRAMLSAFFDEMREQIQAFGGTVEKYAGDAIMAVFGVPRVSEDDAERAVRAALAMRHIRSSRTTTGCGSLCASAWPRATPSRRRARPISSW
jgi:class 3 adenylate cyclase